LFLEVLLHFCAKQENVSKPFCLRRFACDRWCNDRGDTHWLRIWRWLWASGTDTSPDTLMHSYPLQPL
jgi:hypothetical protein